MRVCTDLHGRRWAEEIETLDDSSHSVTFKFMAEAEDFPFPVAALSGGWTVMPDASGGALVDVWWIVTLRGGAFGWLLVALMTVPLDRSVPDIVAAMEADAMGEQAPRRHRRPGLAHC